MITRRRLTSRLGKGPAETVAFVFATLLIAFATVPTISGEENLSGIILEEVRPKVITPNGDLRNDVVFFQFDTSVAGLPIEADIRDIRGARISGMEMNTDEDALTWDGRDDDGRVMPSGIYLYSIKIGQSMATGTVIVAR
jgi:hypothetical protein